MVHEAVRPVTVGRLLKNKARTVSALYCCIALLGGCGGSGDSSGPEKQAEELPQPTVAPLRLAECSDWRKGSVDQRRGTVVQIREFAGGPVGSSQGIQKGPVLGDAQAYLLLDRWCSNRIARGFRLYKLYTRAAAFAGRQGNASPFERVPPSKNPSGS